MPPGKGGSLSGRDYLAIVAFDLGAKRRSYRQDADAETAKAIVLH
jgi:hypothetical protein